MTFTEVKELLLWARTNRVAQLKLGTGMEPAIDITFYPDKEAPDLVSHKSEDWRSQVDRRCGLDGLEGA